METTLQRLKIFIEFKEFNISRFEKFVGFSNGSLASQMKNNKTIGVDKIEKILKNFPDLSSDWLLKGEGEMLKLLDFPNDVSPKSARYKNISLALTDHDKTNVKLTPSQVFRLEDNYNKLLSNLRNKKSEYNNLFISIEFFESFRDFVEDFSESYIDNFFDVLFDERKFLKGKKFDYENYEKAVLHELDKLSAFQAPLLKLKENVQSFYKEILPIDTNKIIK